MADLPPLRQTENGATSVERDALRGAPVRTAAALALAAAVFLAVVAIAGLGRLDADVVFLQNALGPERAQAPLSRKPAPGVDVRIHDEGYTVSHKGASFSVVSQDVGDAEWKRHVYGVTRETDFGAETIVVKNGRTEEFLTVAKRQGERTWRWQLATRLVPHIGSDGKVCFLDPTRKHSADISLDPVRVLDEHGRDITPRGLRWGLDDEGGTWWLTLKLDDSKLPLPYVIDPAANYPTPLNLRNTVASDPQGWTMGTGSGVVDTTTDNVPAQNATGWYRYNPGTSQTGQLTTIPTTSSTGSGFFVDPVGGATGFPAGNWTFRVVTDIPNATLVAGAAVLTVGVAKGTVTGGVWAPTADILPPTDDPAAQNLRTQVTPKTTTVTFALPAFSIAAGETLFVDFWRHQTGGINSATATQRQLDFYVNDGNAYVTHPAADDTAPSHSLTITELTNPGGQYFNAATATQYYNTAAGGTFRVNDAATDAGSGVASATFPALAATGFAHTAITDTTSPYQSNTYTWTTANTTSPGAQAVSAVDNALNSSNPSPQLTLTRDVTAPSGQTLALVGGPYYTSLSVSLTAGDGSDGGSGLDTSSRLFERDSATLTNGSCGAFSGTWTTVANPDATVASGNCYRYRYSIADNVGNRSATVTASVDAKVDTSAPGAPSLSLAENPADPDQHVSGTTLYYKPGANGGTFRATATASDGQSGIASVAFPAIANVTGGGADASSPYEMDYTWGAATAATGNQNVTATNNAGLTSANGPFTLTQDATAPSGQTLALVGGPYYTSLSVSLTAGDGSDGGSGLDTSSRLFERDSATLTNGSCGAFSGTWTTVANPDATVASGNCYRYRYSIADNVGNRSATVTASVDAKVDTSAPGAPSLSLAENPADPDQHVSGTTLYYKPGANGGTFRATATASDGQSGIASVAFPAIANVTGGGADASSPYEMDYTWGAATAATGNQNVTATNNAGLTSANGPFTLTQDATAPSGQTLALVGGPYYTSLSVSLTAGDGSDGGSGLDTSSRLFERDSATLTNGSCGAFSGTWTTVANPDATVASGNCYRYRYSIADNVGNRSATVTASVDAKVDTSAPAAVVLPPSELTGTGAQYYDGATKTHYFRPGGAGSFTLNASASDAQSDIASVAFPDVSAVSGWTGSTGGSDTTSPYASPVTYAWTAGASAPGARTITATNNAGLTGQDTITIAADSTAPSGQTLALVGGPYYTSLSVSLTAGDGSDGGSGLDTSSRLFERDSATLTNGSCGAFSGTWTTVANPDATVASGNCYRYRYSIADNVGNRSATVTASVDAKVDTSAPGAPSLSLAENPADPDQHVSGTTLYYKPGANGGTFRATATASDGQSGIASVAFPAIANVTGGGADASSPYEMDYTWGAATAATGNQNVTATNNAGLTSANGPFTLTQDATAPSGQTLALVGGPYYTSLSVSLTAGDGSDGGSGLDTSSRLFERDSATLTNGSCGAFSGTWTTVANPDATVASGNCYRYRYSIADNVGNRSATVTASVDAKVDTSAPGAPSLSLAENPADPDQHVSGTTLYYKPGANGGTFRATATASDGQSGIASVAFPAIANVTGGGADASSPYEMDYTWGAATAATGNQNVTATNNAGLTSANGPFTLTQDATAPSGQTLALVGGPYYTSLSVSLTAGDGSDGGSGLDTSSRLFERDSATLTNGSCGAFSGTWTTVANPDATVASGNCYRYRYSIADNVGNRSATVTASVDAKVDTSAPGAPSLSLAENPADPDQHVSGTTLYYKPGANGGTFRATATASDGQSGIASVAFPAIANVTGGGADASSPYEMDYTWGAATAATGNQNVTATNNAGLTSANGPFTLTQDGSVPSTTDDTASIGFGWKTTSQVVTLTPGDGAGSGVAATYYTTDSSTPTTSSAQGTSINLTADGVYTIKYFSVDNVGNTEPVRTGSTQIRIDQTNPSSATLDALPGAIRNGQVLTGSGDDAGSGVASITYLYCSGTSCTPATTIGTSSTGPNYSVTWSSMPADGNVRVRARVTDVAGNTLDSAIQNVVVDNTNPTGSLTAPADASFVAGSVTVSSNSADSGSGVASAQFERRPAGGGSWTSIGTDSTSPYSVSWDTTSLADGDYDLRVVTTDQAGNTFTSSTRTVTVDNDSPSVTIVAPTGFVNGGSPDPFTMSATTPDGDVDQVQFFRCSNASAACGGGSWVSLGTDTSAPYSASWPIDADGNRALRAVATDHASNTGADVVDVTIDRTDPTGSLTAPANAAFLVGTVAVSSNSADSGSGVASAQFERRPAGGGAWSSIGTDMTSPYSVSWNTTSLADGDYDLRVVTTDQAGNTFTSSLRTVTVDNTAPSAPVITLSESSPYAYVSGTEIFLNTNQSDSYDVAATSSDAASGIAKITFPGGIDDLSSPYQTSYGFLDLFATQTVTAHNGAGLTASSDFEVTEDVDAPTGGSVSYTGGYDADGQVPVSVDAGTDPLSGIAAGTGVLERRTSALTGNSCAAFSGAWSTVTSPDTLASGLCAQYRYRVSDHVGNEATYGSGAVVKVDLSAPSAPVITLSESSPYAYVSGTEIFLNTNQSDSYDVAATSSDAASGIAKITFPGGIDDLSSPYQTSYGFLDLFATQTVTAHNGAGLTASSDFEVTEDVDAPTGGSVSYTGGYDADGQVPVSVDAGTDPLSGIAAGTGVLERRTSALTGNSCAAFSGAWSTVTSPDTLASGLCAQYRYRVSDHVGNEATYGSGAVVKVDLSAPSAPVITLSESSPYAYVSGTEIFLNTNQSDSYDVAATSSDAASGIAKITFPGGIDDLSSPYQTSYGFLDLFATQTVTAHNGAGLTASSDFEVTEDVDAPTGGSVSYTGGYDADGQVPVSVDAGTDPLSGIAAGTGVLERRTSALTGNSCAAFSGAWSTVTSPDTLASGLCAQYRYRVSDHVGNEATYGSGAVVKVDLSAPSAPVITLSESSPYAYVSGTEIFLNTNQSDSYDVAATSSDAASGIAKITFPGGIDDLSSPYQTSYGFLDLFATQTVTAHNGAGLTASSDFEVTEDVDAPTGGSVSYTGGYDADGQVPVSVDAGTDPLSGIAAGTGVLERRTSALTGNSCAAFSGAWSTVTSPDTLASGLCAQYRYRVSDHVGNEATYGSGAVVKVDLSAPSAPVITLSESSPYAYVSGTEIFLNTNQSDSYDVAATSSDAASGIAKITFPGGIDDLSSPYQTSYGFLDLFATQTVTAHNGAGLTASSDFEVTEDVDAPTGGSVSYTGGYDADGQVPVSVDAGTDPLSGIAAGTGVLERRTSALTGNSCAAFSGAWSTVTSPDTLASGLCAQYRYRVSDHVGNEATYGSGAVVKVDLSAPSAPVITLSESSPYAYVSGTEIFLNTNQSDSYDVAATSSDAASGIAKITFPGGIDDLSSPYQTSYGFLDLFATQTVTAHNGAGLTASSDFEVTEDVDAPTGGSVSYTGGYDADGQVPVSVDAGTDPLSGIAAGTGVLERRTSALTGNSCAAFSGAWSTVTSPDTLASGLCAQYRYRVSDHVGNEATYGSGAVVKVDLSAPSAPVITLSESSPYAYVSGTEIFLNTNQSDSYDVAATSSDAASGIAKITFPGGIDDLSSPYQTSYGFLDLFATQTVTAHNGAGLTASSDFEVTEDVDAPTGGSVSYTGGYDADGQVPVSVDAGTDPLSGIAAGTGVLERRTSALTGNSCAAFSGAWSTVTSPDTLASGLCAQYRYRVSDHVGNEATYGSGAVVKVDLSAPSAPVITLSESSPYAYVSGTEIFLNTNQSDSYDVAATSSDAASGIAKITFPGGIDDLSSPYQTSYGFLDLFATQTVTAHNGAGLTASSDFEVTEDVDAPSTSDDTSSIGTAWQTAPVTVTLTPSDSGAGVAATYYTTDGSLPTTSSAQGTTINLSADGVYVIRYFSVDRVGNVEPVRTAFDIIRIDKTDPAQPTITLSESSPYAYVSGSEIFVNTGQSGSYDVDATSSDATAGIERMSFPGGVDDATSPYGTSYGLGDLSGVQTVTAHDYAGNTASDTFTVTPDTAAPSGGSVSYADGYDADGQVPVSVDAGTDPLSGIAAGTGVLERRTSALTGNSCAAFSGAWSTVTSPDTLASDLCAQYRYRVSDHVGNEATYTSANVVKVDLDGPQTTIDSAPSDPSSDTSPSFAFSSNEPGATFECRLDAGAWTACTSPESVGPLADGSHDFAVRATDGAGNTDATPASHTWTVDTVAPQTTIVLVPADPSNDDAPTFEFESDEPGAAFECRVDAGAWTPCTSPEVAGLLADGSHTFEVRAIDGAGNTDPTPASYAWTVDTAAPDTTFTTVPGSPSNNASPSFDFDSSEPGSSFECRLDGSIDWDPCASPASVGPLVDGSHTFDVRATDPAGNTDGSPASHTWTVDTGPPPVSITQPSGFVNASDADPYTVRATSPDTDVAGVEFFSCSDASAGCAGGSWISLGTDSTVPFEASWPVDPDGNRALRAVATDTASNVGSVVMDVTIDRTVPDTTIDSAPSDPSSDTSPSFDFSSNEPGATFECRLDAGAWTACTSPEAYSGLADGSHTFRTRATDGAGNTDATPATYSWTVDTTAPQTTIDSSPSNPSSSASPSFDFSSSEPGSTFECRLDAGAWTACSSPEAYSGLADGSHTFSVRATDAAGNVDPTPASYTWTIDATPPGGGLADPGQYLRGTVALSASPSDTGVGVQSVDFQVSPANAGSWSSIDVDTTSPYGAAWNTTLVADGLYDLRVVVTDNAGNSTASAVVEDRMVDNTAPGATMNDPGAYLRGTVGLTSNVSDAGSGVASVAYQRSPANAGTWTSVPASWNTTSVADGLYDLRVVVTDNAGNSTTSAAVEDRTVDNTKPGLSTSDPFDGTTLAAAGTLQVVASEAVSGIVGATIDGGAAPPASVTGDTVTYTQSFATGPHTLAGELEDLAGNRQPIRVHFTVWSGTASDYPYVEKNSFAAATMSLAATNAASTLTVPAGAWSGAPAGDWLVLRLDPQPSTGASGGFQPAGDVLDVTAYWALAGTGVTSFSSPLELEIDNTLSQVIPATFESGAWRTIAAVPGSSLPGSWQDGFERDGTNVRIFTRHLSRFTLLRDVQAPSVPGGFKGAVKKKKFSLSWAAASDNSGLVAGYRIYANNAVVKAVGGSTLTAAMGAFKTTDKKAYTVAAVDEAGNVGSRTYALKVVPKVAKLTLSSAKKSLKKRGFKAGRVTYKASAKVPQGKVIKARAAGLRRSGTKIGLMVSKGGGAAHRPVPLYTPYTPYPPAPPPSYTTPPPSSTPPPAPTSPDTTSPDPTETGTGTAAPQNVRLAPHELLLAESSSDFDTLRRELGFGLMAAAFTFAFLAGLRARRPREEPEGVDPELLWDSRALQSVGRALRRLTGRP